MPEAPGATVALADALGDPDRRYAGPPCWRWAGSVCLRSCPYSSAWWSRGQRRGRGGGVGTLSRDSACLEWLTTTLVDEPADPTTDSATRIRLTQALYELTGTTVQEVLRQLTDDQDHEVALIASAFVRVLDERSSEVRADEGFSRAGRP